MVAPCASGGDLVGPAWSWCLCATNLLQLLAAAHLLPKFCSVYAQQGPRSSAQRPSVACASGSICLVDAIPWGARLGPAINAAGSGGPFLGCAWNAWISKRHALLAFRPFADRWPRPPCAPLTHIMIVVAPPAKFHRRAFLTSVVNDYSTCPRRSLCE